MNFGTVSKVEIYPHSDHDGTGIYPHIHLWSDNKLVAKIYLSDFFNSFSDLFTKLNQYNFDTMDGVRL